MSDSAAITLRAATEADRPFLARVYAESRAEELAATNWSDQEKAAFCQRQFEAQDRHYHQHYPGCQYFVIESGGWPIGRLYRDLRDDEIRVVDIALLATERGQGVGGRLMQDIITEAGAAELAVRIHVERTNPVLRLYERLGFRLVAAGEVYNLLVWEKTN